MKSLARVIVFLVCLALLVGLAAILSYFTVIPWLSTFVQGLVAAWPWLPLAFSIVILFFMALCVLGLILTVTVPGKQGLFVLHKDAGKIEITRQSIASSVGATLENTPGVKRYHTRIKGNPSPHKLKVDVQVEPRNGEGLSALGQDIQQRVKADLHSCLGIDAKHVRVRIEPIVHQNAAERRTEIPRVV